MSTESKAAADFQQQTALTFGAILLRLWLAVRALQTGIEKFAGTTTEGTAVKIDSEPNEYGLETVEKVKEYSLSNYHGVPEALYDTFSKEPLIPGFFLKAYDWVLGPALLILGLTILLGIASRVSVFLLGLLYVSLTWGLILLGAQGDPGVAWLGVHMIMIVMLLMLSEHNRFCILKKW